MSDVGLFGQEIDEFKTALERYGVWPITVWDCNKSDRHTQALKQAVGDGAIARQGSWNHEAAAGGFMRQGAGRQNYRTARKECFTKTSDDKSVFRGKVTESIFDPAVAAWLLNCYAPKTGLCFDPFAGGGTRAIMAAKYGLAYLGVELRREECEAVKTRCEKCRVADFVHIECGDARDCSQIASDASADFLLTCPPYWNLEQYRGGHADLSMCESYGDFLQALNRVVRETARILKPGAVSCWVVGLHRHKGGELIPMHHDVTSLHRAAGYTMKEEIILSHKNNGAIQRVGNFDKGDRRLIRTHEYALIFVR
jgi:DNA modification methylase